MNQQAAKFATLIARLDHIAAIFRQPDPHDFKPGGSQPFAEFLGGEPVNARQCGAMGVKAVGRARHAGAKGHEAKREGAGENSTRRTH